jgi:hypothetical protein
MFYSRTVGISGIIISYSSLGYGVNPLHIPANGNSASVKMTIDIPLDVAPGPLPLTVTAMTIQAAEALLALSQLYCTLTRFPDCSNIRFVFSHKRLHKWSKSWNEPMTMNYEPQWFQLDPATGTVTIGSIEVDNTVFGSVQYFFSSWTDSTSNPHPTITTSEPVTLTANYVTKTSQITITSNPTGLDFISVDGATYRSPHTFAWAVGSTHNLQALSPIAGTSGIQYIYDNWTDNGAQSHSYTVSSTNPETVAANYKTQYSVTFPPAPGRINQSFNWNKCLVRPRYAPNICNANAGYHFDHWSSSTGSITFGSLTEDSTECTINGPGTVTANFAFNPVTHFSVVAQSSVTAGSSFPVTVTALDEGNNLISGYTGTVHITSSYLQAVLPVDATLINGVGIFTVTLKTAGSQDVFAADNSISGSASVNVVADSSPARFVVSAPSTVSAGVPFSFTVTAKDIYGNTVTGYTGTVHFTSTDNSAILPSDYTFQASDSGSKSSAWYHLGNR